MAKGLEWIFDLLGILSDAGSDSSMASGTDSANEFGPPGAHFNHATGEYDGGLREDGIYDWDLRKPKG